MGWKANWALAPAVKHSAQNCRTLARQRKAQGLKPRSFWTSTARLKSGPDTKHQSGDSIRLRAYRRFRSIHPLDLPDVVPETLALNQETPLCLEWRFLRERWRCALRLPGRSCSFIGSSLWESIPGKRFFAQAGIDLLRIRSPLKVFMSEAEAIGTHRYRFARQVRRPSSARLRDGHSIAAPPHGSSSIQPVR
jgi:hypothetical protein